MGEQDEGGVVSPGSGRVQGHWVPAARRRNCGLGGVNPPPHHPCGEQVDRGEGLRSRTIGEPAVSRGSQLLTHLLVVDLEDGGLE